MSSLEVIHVLYGRLAGVQTLSDEVKNSPRIWMIGSGEKLEAAEVSCFTDTEVTCVSRGK